MGHLVLGCSLEQDALNSGYEPGQGTRNRGDIEACDVRKRGGKGLLSADIAQHDGPVGLRLAIPE
jgi:hypothetical protein